MREERNGTAGGIAAIFIMAALAWPNVFMDSPKPVAEKVETATPAADDATP